MRGSMAKKETKQKEKKEKNKKKGKAETAAPSSATPSAQGGQIKQGGAKNGGAPAQNINDMQLDRSKVTAEELTQAQIEEAIKESQDPTTKLKKLRSPLSVRGCLLNILILVVLTVGIVLLCCYFMLDHETFNLWVVIKDMSEKLGVTGFFRKIAGVFKKIFKM